MAHRLRYTSCSHCHSDRVPWLWLTQKRLTLAGWKGRTDDRQFCLFKVPPLVQETQATQATGPPAPHS
jgi:hypothetical protein